MVTNFALLNPRSRENIATLLRCAQNFGVASVAVIGGAIRDKYKGNIHKFSHQMDTQDGLSHVAVYYFETLADYLKHLPAQTTLNVVETVAEAALLESFVHAQNASYLLGPELSGFTSAELAQIERHFAQLHDEIPTEHLASTRKTAHLRYLKIDTPASLNVAVCGAIVMYDRHAKAQGGR
ncbi:TrmH family RNA methyltransferase [Ferrimonas pelagia]|uniref:tRNA/rRNA methyltransferase SpoU type domain-containing protein n=1 Tax=Ferrimonas pelagia TaxID=1177826 RepID=A0ABP9EJ11_9GAMM